MGLHPKTKKIFLEWIEKLEGFHTKAYLDVSGIPTICAGLTSYPNGTPVRMGDVCSAPVCRKMLEERLDKEFIPQLLKIPGFDRFGPYRQAALLSFAFNAGAYFFGHKGYTSITQVLIEGAKNPSAYARVPDVLRLYNKSHGRAVLGSRREKEIEFWLKEEDGPMDLKALVDTVLKKAPIDSKFLSEAGIHRVSKDEIIKVDRYESIAADSHAWVDLSHGAGRWALFGPHFQRTNGTQEKQEFPINWQDVNGRVSEYLTVGEVTQYDKRRIPRTGSAEERNIIEIARQFDAIRKAWKGPIGVTSGFRPEPINSQVGGASSSQHIYGKALDIYPIGGSLNQFHEWLVKRWSGGYGDGRRKGFIHIDTRSNGRFHPLGGAKPSVIWDY